MQSGKQHRHSRGERRGATNGLDIIRGYDGEYKDEYYQLYEKGGHS